jgi:acetyltransferase
VIAIRPIARQDQDAFQTFVRGLSPESRTNRFLYPLQELAPASLQALTQPDQARHVGLVAVEGERIVGEGRFVALGTSERGELALAVADDWQRQGLGARLLGALSGAALRTGIAFLEGEVLRTNVAMLKLMRRAGFRVSICPGDATLAIVERDLRGA